MRLSVCTSMLCFGFISFCNSQPPAPTRLPFSTGKIVGSPEPPPPFQTSQPYPKLKFDHPLLLVPMPGSDRLFVGEQRGVISSFKPTADGMAELFVDLPREIKTLSQHPNAKGVEAVYGMVFHPKFAENRQVFICYTLKGKKMKQGRYDYDKNLPDGTRLSRFTVTKTEPPRVEIDSEKILLTWLQGGHNAGDLQFGPDGYLYISTGDSTDPAPPDLFNTGQDISDLMSSILRIDVDHDSGGKGYTIPTDNPFVNLKGARGEVWAFGFRNPWRMSFDRANGDLWVGDVGWELWEMVHKVEKGGNYGWSIVEGRQPIRSDVTLGPTPILPPALEYPHSVGASVTGGYVYRGKKFPDLLGAYIFGDWETRKIWAANLSGNRLINMREITEASLRVVAFGEDHQGEIYVVDYDTGRIHGIERRPPQSAQQKFPTKLSETGLFNNVAKHQYADGVIPFDVAIPKWEDGATAERFLALPDQNQILWHNNPKQFEGSMFSRTFEFPKNAILGRTVTMPVTVDRVTKKRKLETQILHHDGRDWRGYVYAWNEAQTDAELVGPDGGELDIRVPDSKTLVGQRDYTWTHASRSQCVQCHNPWAQSALGFTVEQLNRGEGNENILSQFELLGVLKRVDNRGKELPQASPSDIKKQKSLAMLSDTNKSIEDRARSYFHVNCGSCHRNGGGGSVEVMLNMDEKDMKAIKIRPRQGDFGIQDAAILKPGDPYRSVLLYRMAKTGSGRMPHIGSECVDPQGVGLIAEWIRSLEPTQEQTKPNGDESVVKQLGSTSGALKLAEELANGQLNDATRIAVLKVAQLQPAGPVRDLFEGYLPRYGERKLGAAPKWISILGKQGDPLKGKSVFFHQNQTCKNCHQLEGQGVVLGPDLSKLGASRTREDLLESLLEPSRRIEPQFQTTIVKTEDGRTITGLLIKKDAVEVVLKDAENKEHKIPLANVSSVKASSVSLMPTGLLANLTAQEAADLLAYLKSLK